MDYSKEAKQKVMLYCLYYNIALRPMRVLDAEELAMYKAFIESKKKIIKKSIL